LICYKSCSICNALGEGDFVAIPLHMVPFLILDENMSGGIFIELSIAGNSIL
jgi:hypothetical protein